MTKPPLITIGNGHSQCVLCPDRGGSIVRWTVDGQQMLRSLNDEAIASATPLMFASFPLVPYSNRIGYAKFRWGGQTISIAPNFAPEPHALHGIGWTMPWQIDEVAAHCCVLSIEHLANEHWPFAFSASQHFELTDSALKITATATNHEAQPVPLAFGHHPYFDRNGASLRFHADAVLMNGADGLPSESILPDRQYDFTQGDIVAGRDIDHCYTRWDGHAEIRWEGRPLALEIRADMQAAVVYIPAEGQDFCFEPVPHVNNAINRPELSPSMPIAEPGATFTSTVVLQTVRADKA
jgi:aldose 1-epimerase